MKYKQQCSTCKHYYKYFYYYPCDVCTYNYGDHAPRVHKAKITNKYEQNIIRFKIRYEE